MSQSSRDKAAAPGDSKRHVSNNNNVHIMPAYPIDDIVSPFGDAAPNISDSELRETAYEILVGACRSTGVRPLTYIPQSERAERTPAPSLSSAPSLQRSLTSTAASKVKKALGMKSIKKRVSGGESVGQGKAKRAVTVGELVRAQMRISEQTDSRIRRALLRIAGSQVRVGHSGNYDFYRVIFVIIRFLRQRRFTRKFLRAEPNSNRVIACFRYLKSIGNSTNFFVF